PNSIFNDPFSMFNDPMFNSTVVPIKVTSSKVTIQAKPLPGGKGSGEVWVGNITVTASIQPTTIPVHQSATLVLNIKGNSSVKTLNMPELKQVNGIEFYPPQSKIFGEGESIRREIRYPLLPRAPGKYTLEFQPISIFDPASKQYRNFTSEELTLVAEGVAAGSQPSVYVPQEPPTIAGEEQLPVPINENTGNPLLFHSLTWILSGGIIGISLLAKLILLLRNRGSVQERGKLKKIRLQLIETIRNYGESSKTTSEDIERILGNYLGIRYGNPNFHFAHPDQLESVKEPSAATWMALWQELRELRYQPSQLIEQLRADWKDRTIQLLKGSEL
ncbi:MAG: BatD family protein, partial [bacterium]|nr:BatD family protein [bacterium]